ncbi:hypothetical protein FGO68_gene9979 [Halteria grandinella]|uniref:Amino acid transporter transmembrane domain-containing protein n=1 Tax=Halteria grandinella TaxID=5974 RepID=A0A8J8NSF2_HALGN|nr:hypothetical protein FGO68_gene9979 [Halteria grandinella]
MQNQFLLNSQIARSSGSSPSQSGILADKPYRSDVIDEHSLNKVLLRQNSGKSSEQAKFCKLEIENEMPLEGLSKDKASSTPSDLQLFFVTVKLFFGISYLSMPNTFAQCGLVGGILLFTFVITINGITMLQILKVADAYRDVKSYSDLGERVLGPRGRVLVDISILVKQLGVCVTYLYFVSTQLDFIICQYTDACFGNKLYMLLLIMPVILMSQIGSYRFLGSLSIPSICIALTGMLCIFYYSFSQMTLGSIKSHNYELKYFDGAKIIGRIGLAMYIFDGNAIVVNIRAEANEKKTYYPRILVKAIIFSLVLFTLFATICYLVYREDTQPIFTMSLVPINSMVVFILACICINALTSYPIQILAAFTIIERFTMVSSDSQLQIDRIKRVSLRSLIIVMTTVVCMMVKTFTDFINIAGALGSVTVAFILPQWFFLSTYRQTLSMPQKIGCWAIAIFGIIGSSYSIYYSIQKLSKGDFS